MSIQTIVWIALLVFFVIIEAATAQLVTIWFAAGALVSLIAALLHAPIWLQAVLFFVVSGITLAATRPLVKKLTKKQESRLNADRCIGQTAVVTEAVDNLAGKGMVKADGKDWSARSADGSIIPEGTYVTIEKIEGVKLIVK